ncbi:serine/threonine-protein kinase 32A-like [Symsagittifera roscoffensis]|uniref:serine/threonine-protein kinase 32A-like n=1 Tax=Symsagittifera roscoffensis TaxID=84072 RepID=UPI00307C323E
MEDSYLLSSAACLSFFSDVLSASNVDNYLELCHTKDADGARLYGSETPQFWLTEDQLLATAFSFVLQRAWAAIRLSTKKQPTAAISTIVITETPGVKLRLWMGGLCTKKEKSAPELPEEVDLSHFQILQSIGRGAFGKVCIVKKIDTDKFYAMKYTNKKACLQNKAVEYVLKEQQILMALTHTFLCNLWYTFQDQEDMFMVSELFRGGDLRFHIDSKSTVFDKHTLKIYALEIGLALDYLKSKGVVHRDIKPDNILLDENGHLALTDFNVAAICTSEKRLTNLAGTKHYMAPELLETATRKSKSYSFEVDWWSTGVTLYETFRRRLPYEIPNNVQLSDCYRFIKTTDVKWTILCHKEKGKLVKVCTTAVIGDEALHGTRVTRDGHSEVEELLVRSGLVVHRRHPLRDIQGCFHDPPDWDPNFVEVLRSMLDVNPKHRVSSCDELNRMKFFGGMKKEEVLNKLVRPSFVPSDKNINCNATFELEEMILEAEPLHKKGSIYYFVKKKRLKEMEERKSFDA